MNKGSDPVAEAMARSRSQEDALMILAEVMVNMHGSESFRPSCPRTETAKGKPVRQMLPAVQSTPVRCPAARAEARIARLLQRIERDMAAKSSDDKR